MAGPDEDEAEVMWLDDVGSAEAAQSSVSPGKQDPPNPDEQVEKLEAELQRAKKELADVRKELAAKVSQSTWKTLKPSGCCGAPEKQSRPCCTCVDSDCLCRLFSCCAKTRRSWRSSSRRCMRKHRSWQLQSTQRRIDSLGC
jgi:hypothetical protein